MDMALRRPVPGVAKLFDPLVTLHPAFAKWQRHPDGPFGTGMDAIHSSR